MFSGLYRSTLALADSPRAPYALAAIAFAESSFFPIPPDIILIPMSLARPRRALVYAAICTVASVLGGMLGYAIGALLFDTVGQWLVGGHPETVQKVRDFYAQWGALFILVKGLTPIPYKLVTIVSGSMGYNFALFVLLSLITRGARFFILAGLLNRFGAPIGVLLERYFALFLLVLALIVVAGFWLVARFT